MSTIKIIQYTHHIEDSLHAYSDRSNNVAGDRALVRREWCNDTLVSLKADKVQKDFQLQSAFEVEGNLQFLKLYDAYASQIFNRKHEYQYKFSDKDDELSFTTWLTQRKGTYEWDYEMCQAVGDLPEDFDCWCEVMEYYLHGRGDFTLNTFSEFNKFSIYKKDNPL